MQAFSVECLRCGTARIVGEHRRRHVDAGECPRCEYVGWALSRELTEATRRLLRERPPERRAAVVQLLG